MVTRGEELGDVLCPFVPGNVGFKHTAMARGAKRQRDSTGCARQKSSCAAAKVTISQKYFGKWKGATDRMQNSNERRRRPSEPSPRCQSAYVCKGFVERIEIKMSLEIGSPSAAHQRQEMMQPPYRCIRGNAYKMTCNTHMFMI